jgi:hypothetical protein
MPWTAAEATSHTKKANTPERRKKWAKIANAALKTYNGNEGKAIATANAAMGDAFWNGDEFVGDADLSTQRRRKTLQRDPMGRETATYEESDAADLFRIVGDAEPARVAMCDTIELDDAAKVTYTRDGVLKAMPRIARTGIQLYHGDECGRPDLEQVRVYRPADSVFANDAVRSYTNLPITLDHPREIVTTENWKKYAVGDTGEDVLRDGTTVRVPMMLRDASAIRAFKDGKNQLSVGYDCDLDWSAGVTEDGEEYDAVQSNIRANHLAVVANARGGDQLKIGDDGSKGDHAMNLKTVVVDGIECQMADTAAAIVQRTIQKMNDSYKKLSDEFDQFKKKKEAEEEECEDSIKKAEDGIKAKDAEIVTLKQQLADAKVTPAKLDAMSRDRAEVVGKARAVLGDKLKVDDIELDEIRKQVVDAKLGDRAKGWGPGEIKASFDSLTHDVKPASSGNTVKDAVSAFSTPMHPYNFADAEAIKQKAYDEMVKGGEEAWKNLGRAAQ